MLLLIAAAVAWRPMMTNVRSVLGRSVSAAAAIAALSSSPFPALAELAPSSWDPTVKVEVLTAPKPDAKAPKQGDMVTIRFMGTYNGNTFDDTFKTDQPYYYRAGVGLIMKGVDDAVVHMKEGEKLALQFGGDNSFPNGKPSSPGKPRIPAGAVVDYVVLLEALPGQGDPDALILD